MITKEDNPTLFIFFDGPFFKDMPEKQKGERIQKMCSVLTGIVADIIRRKKPDILDGGVHVADIPVRWWHLLAVLYKLRYTREGDHTKFRNAILAIPKIQEAYRSALGHQPKTDLSEIIRQGLTRPKNSQEYLNAFYNHCSSGVEKEWPIKLPEKDKEIIKNLEEKLNEDALEKVKMPVELSGNDAKPEQKTAGGNDTSGPESMDTGNGPKKSVVQASDSGVDAGDAEPVKKSEVSEVHDATVSGGVQNGGARADAGMKVLVAPAVSSGTSKAGGPKSMACSVELPVEGYWDEVQIEPDADCYVKRNNANLITAEVGKENPIWFKKGYHKLKFESVDDNSIFTEEIYHVEDVPNSHIIEVKLKSLLEEKKRKEKEKRIASVLNGHEYVDLGLPSGTLWATCNVGASKPSEYGDYFAWGETKQKNSYVWGNLAFRTKGDSYDNVKFSKYVLEKRYGQPDGKGELEIGDDAARANWGGEWRMPTQAEWKELNDNCDSEWTTENGVKGRRFTSKINGNGIFLPAAGWCGDSGSPNVEGSYGCYWSSSLHSDYSYGAFDCYFYSDDVDPSYWGSRCYGLSVRPVLSSSSFQ